jgi:hypothetical protein
MASKNSSKTKCNSEVVEIVIVSPKEKVFSKQVALNYDGIVKLTTPVGNKYTWERGGHVLVIENELDFDYIIRRELPKSCCGSQIQQFMFLEI